MIDHEEFAWLDATALAELVRKGEVTPSELVEATIERIEKLNPSVNAVVEPMVDEARRTAAADLPDGPFRGVPFLLKDAIAAYAGVAMRSGAAFLQDFVPHVDSELVARIKRAGLIVVGKTSTPELSLTPVTESRLFGRTINPWDTSRTPGGSSGGSAVAVACGMVPMAHGSDGGGSLRIPASCCGVFTLKPTRGRNPLGPAFGDAMGGLISEHALTRSVRDSALLLDATSGPDLGDPYCAPPPVRPFAEEVRANPGKLRIALMTAAGPKMPVHPDCVAAAEEAAKLCTDLGHRVEEAAPRIDFQQLGRDFLIQFSAGAAWTMNMLASGARKTPQETDFEPQTWALAEMGRRHSAADYLAACTRLQRASRGVARFLTEFDVLLTPTLAEPPLPMTELDPQPDNPLAGLFRTGSFVAFTTLANITGQPAMSVPLAWNEDGLPIGVQFAGRFGDEATLFRLAAQLEQAQPWANRRPNPIPSRER